MIPTLSEALAERGFDTLTEVQQAVTAAELAEADLLVSAQTGSGKTVGFGLAIAPTLMGDESRLDLPGAPLALIVAPTRELALQVQRELAWLYARAGARVVSCIGGMDAREERRALERGAHIVVGTPGRLRDHITRGSLDLSAIRAVVLDEADEMLDLGFREDLEFMLGEAPAERRTLMFSATVSPAIADLAKAYQRDAVRVTTLSRGTQHTDIAYQVVQVAAADSDHAIINLLRFHDAPTAIVFANTRAAVARLAARLANRGLPVVSLSGELSQDERSHALQALRDGRARVCVATDVAARGIDLPNLDLVIHADLPTNTEALLHRSGRTGRAGRKGISALIVPDRVTAKATRLLKWAKIEAEWTAAPSREEILALDETRLLADPVWEDAPSEAEAAFAARLLAEHGPEQIAAACLRLYRAGLSAPEELNAAPARTERAERAPFGPSAWFELSIGQNRRAEARWILPLLCRAGDLDKTQIGRIRILPETTLVEIAEPAAPGLIDRLGPAGILEEDITARQVEGTVEDMRPPRPAPGQGRPARKEASAPRPPRKAPAPVPAASRPAPVAAEAPNPVAAAPQPAAPARAPDDAKPRKPRHAAPKRDGSRAEPRGTNGPGPKGAPAGDRTGSRSQQGPKRMDRPGPKAAKAKDDAAPRKPRNPAQKWDAARPKSDTRGPERAERKDETGSARTRPGASDTSKRMDRPATGARRTWKGKPKGGDTPPRRTR
ncbi:DEAD/DEAH box helicase [Rhodovulum steppense]|uniref:ATP-dependent RNA helicase DeaD n=1 Tax=Rhodovulum steppense TaxID=540251 RepID=A0A4R1YL74_9RHOB|nr:DEAD/DEAH box helicase [Rhodovulum steppense]TCM77579.1 ATP-dependent RNA helicase DeaD [Rhodovulum steppense]